MHELDREPQAIQRRTTTSGEPTTSNEIAGYAPARAPKGVHGEASLLHLQRMAGNASVVQMLAEEGAIPSEEERSPVHDVIGKGGGTPLDEGTRSSMESRFGQDFSDVRLHTDAQASASAEAVGANAYTVGNEIAFRSGHFDASSPTGQRTLAHELSHVVQQRSGPVDGTEASGGIRLSDPSDRFERAADATADQVMSSHAEPVGAGAGSASGGTSVQLEEADEGDEGGAPVQREAAGGEQEEDEMGAG
ncbi:MAG TPA: DUF4157 domain-containing protein [Candidatus Limnocylindrales bacterium]|nr:DUF4157 domain-containing protein [Candidatus Limnocylindrales bacterium]